MRIDLAVPEPCLVVLVGVAGSGKSTFAARHFAPGDVLASDGFRARLGRDEADQGVNRTAFAVLHAALERRLAAGRTTVVDATNVRADARHALVRRAAAAGVPAIAIVLDLPLPDCLAGDRARSGRHVPPAVIERQWAQLRATLDGLSAGGSTAAAAASTDVARLEAEGFAAAHLLRSRSAADAVRVRRGGEGWPTLSPATLPRGRR
jgi:protein phosphatase